MPRGGGAQPILRPILALVGLVLLTVEAGAMTMSWLGQSFNSKAMLTLGKVMRQPNLAVPKLTLDHVGLIDFAELRRQGIRGIIFDKDNTLTAPYVEELHPLVEEGLARCKKEFGDRVCIMSNSAGTNDDAEFVAALRIEEKLGIPVLRHTEKKPGGLAETLAFFSSQSPSAEGAAAADDRGTPGGVGAEAAAVAAAPAPAEEDGGGEGPIHPSNLCVIGDRLLTDIVFGNLHGMFTIHTLPLTLKGDNVVAAAARFLESKLILPLLRRKYRVTGLPPPPVPEARVADPPHGDAAASPSLRSEEEHEEADRKP